MPNQPKGSGPECHYAPKSSFFFLEARQPPQNPETRVYTNFFEKFARTFALFSVTQVRNQTEFVQERLVQMNFYILGGFFGCIFLL